MQRDVAGGIDYCRRKVLLVRDKVEQLASLVKQRQAALAQVDGLMEQRAGQEQQQAQQQGAAAAGGQQAAGQKK